MLADAANVRGYAFTESVARHHSLLGLGRWLSSSEEHNPGLDPFQFQGFLHSAHPLLGMLVSSSTGASSDGLASSDGVADNPEEPLHWNISL